jgi:hypothetical protein
MALVRADELAHDTEAAGGGDRARLRLDVSGHHP